MRRQPKPRADTARYFEALFYRYHRPELLAADPLSIVHRFEDPADREIAALLSALLAYGGVKQINGSLNSLFGCVSWKPARFLEHFDFRDACVALENFKYRFNDGEDIAALLWLVRRTQEEFGSLENAFLRFDGEEDYAGALIGVLNQWLAWLRRSPRLRRLKDKRSLVHLLATPERGSACKRWFLFLRWVVRPPDGVDLGLWRRCDPGKLLYPVDRHVLRIANNVGIVRATSATLKVARVITHFFRTLDVRDPVRFDFALCHLGIVGACPTTPDIGACNTCELASVCQLRSRLASHGMKQHLSSLEFASRAQEFAPKRRGR
ncbi:MAG: TIGR02757 family protein [Candidatus Sumerlaeaceae bacterium]|jgi:uncharacterized protein (TIGR02757 family)